MEETTASAPAPGDEDWVALPEPASETEAAIVVGFLEAEGIPARLNDRSFHQTPTPDNEELKEIDLYVPRSRFEEARSLLAAREKAFASLAPGEEMVLTDDGPADIDTSEKVEPPDEKK